MKITTILLDVGGVLARTESTRARRIWEKKLGLLPRQLTKELTKVQPAKEATTGLVSADTIWQNVAEKFSLNKTDVNRMRKDFFAGEKVNKKFYSYIQNLHENYRIVLFTNAWDDGREIYSNKFHLDKICDKMIISAEVGMRKPQKKFYKYALKSLRTTPTEVIYIDDTEANIRAAREMGIRSILFRSTEQAISDLNTALGISPPEHKE